MKVDIFIKNQRIDLYDGVNYTLTKQVNDFTELRTRQWDYTNKLKVPKTANNKRVFDFLGAPANTSTVAYERIKGAQMYFNGIPIIRSGYALVDETDDDYNVVMYDGTVFFFDAIKDLTLRNLDWTGIDHSYNIDTMEASWANTEGYIYPAAMTAPHQPQFHTWLDVPSPSVYIKDIVQKISEISGVEIEGTMLTDPLYLKSVITTKVGIKLSQESVTQIDTETLNRTVGAATTFTETTPPIVTGTLGYYKIVLNYSVYGDTTPFINFKVGGNSIDAIPLTEETGVKEWIVYGDTFEALMTANNPNGINTSVNMTLIANQINFGAIDVKFSDLMPDTSLSVFMKQIMTIWGVNAYPNNKESKIELNYINDLDTAEIDDISRYYNGGNNEEYQIGSYSSINKFEYSVPDTIEDSSSGDLLYSNNKGEKNTHFTSAFEQPEIQRDSIYKNHLFNEELELNDGNIKIFYIGQSTLTANLMASGGILGKAVVGYAVYQFEDLKFSNLIARYYNFLESRVFKKPVKLKRSFALPIARFYDFDFQKLYYITKLNGHFLVSKIKINSRGLVDAELLQVAKKRIVSTDPVAVITGTTFFTEEGDKEVTLYGTDSYSIGGYIDSYAWEVRDSGDVLISSGTDPQTTFTLTEGMTYTVCLIVTNEQANTNERCEQVESRPPVLNEPDTFSDETLLLSNDCYTLMQVLISGTPSSVMSLNIKSGIINGKSNLVFWDANASIGTNCQVSGCPFVGQIILPKLGPGVNEISYTDNYDYNISLDVNGEAYMQFRVEGVKDAASPIDNGTFITLKDNGTGQQKTIIQRYWAKTYQCDSF